MKTETEEFLEWHKQATLSGLVDIKFTPGSGLTKYTTRDDFSAENNRINRLIKLNKSVLRQDVF